MFSGPSSHAAHVDFIMFYIVAVAVILLIGITSTMIYFVFKYNRKKGHKPQDIHGNVVLETVWIVIPTILVLSMFYFGYMGFKEFRYVPEGAFVVDVTARQWQWQFKYDNGVTTDTLYVPVNKPIKLNLESVDVNHSLYIPAFRIKQDVIYGRKNYMVFTPDEVGSFDIACAEYCGLDHWNMYTKLVVMPSDKFDLWYKKGNASLAKKQ
ncbi:cytochrome c oxidase subunit II [Melioribacteraceae bacterium 4301-Me]|uniref:cytochrome c oxidase subunit II n=1 Tax=Pyranulibacter aquaticus TaxID=3163344 RepID=UPI00359837E4